MPAANPLKAIHDILRRDLGVGNASEGFTQLAWMLFLKIIDDQEIEKEEANKRYRSPIPLELRWKCWASKKEGLAGDDLRWFVSKKLPAALRSLAGNDEVSRLVRDVSRVTGNFVVHDETLLRQSLDLLDEIRFGRPADLREVATAYEDILHGWQTSTGGDHYTPRAVIDFMVEQANPRPGETIFDPACGTAGFLVRAAEHLRNHQPGGGAAERTIRESIHGVETWDFVYVIAITNLLLHSLTPNVRLGNAFEDPKGTRKKRFDVILLTPPFGGMVDGSLVDDLPPDIRSQDSLSLYLHLVTTSLRAGGRAAVVVPDSVLFGDARALTQIKRRLLEECNLHTIVRLPKGVFSPYTGISTNLLFLTKGEPTKEIWYYEHPYPKGYKSYTKTKPLRSEDFDAERAWWGRREETDHAWKVPIGEIARGNYNLDVRKPSRNRGRGPSRVLWLSLDAFRGFKKLALELPRTGPSVIIGVNGAGKSTVLDTIAMQLCLFASLVTGDSADLEPDERDIQNGREQASLRMMMRAGDGEQLWELRGTRADGFESTGKEQEEQAVALREGLSRDPKAGVPVLCFYPATRAFTGGTSPKGRGPSDARLEVYAHAFSRQLGPFQDFAHWFRSEEDAENEGRVRIRPDYRNPRLVVLRRALERFLSDLGESHFSNLRMERLDATASPRARASIGRLVLDMDGQPLGIDQFSEGQRNTLLLVADLARRLAIANPGLEDPLQGEGIVLIDEIDLHLHPSWQRGIVPALCATFPGCQFIVSTHSPQVLSRIQRKNVFILEGFDLVDVTPHTYGRDANSILAEVMGLSERPRDIEEKIREASRLVDEERLDEAKVALHELTAILGDDDNMVVRLRTLASFLEDRS